MRSSIAVYPQSVQVDTNGRPTSRAFFSRKVIQRDNIPVAYNTRLHPTTQKLPEGPEVGFQSALSLDTKTVDADMI